MMPHFVFFVDHSQTDFILQYHEMIGTNFEFNPNSELNNLTFRKVGSFLKSTL
jgi:hypothetical protein